MARLQVTHHLDCAATTLPRRPEALAAASDAASWPIPGRGRHGDQARATAEVEQARGSVLELVEGRYIPCFTAGTTAALNQVIAGLRPAPLRIGLGPLVHNAARRPCLALGVPTWTLPHGPDGVIDIAAVQRDWVAETGLLVVSHGSNVNGVLQPVAALVELAKQRGTRVLVDAAQTAGMLVPLQLGEADAVAFSGHKALSALPGSGVLLAAPGLELEPLVRGGVGFDGAKDDVPTELPARLESGTPNLPGIAAMGAAARACLAAPPDWREVGARLRDAVRSGGAQPLGDGPLPVVSLRPSNVEPRTLEEILDRVYDIRSRAGLHCAIAAHRTLGTADTGTLRVSASSETEAATFDALTRALRDLSASPKTTSVGARG